jgi:hypothetical protein
MSLFSSEQLSFALHGRSSLSVDISVDEILEEEL